MFIEKTLPSWTKVPKERHVYRNQCAFMVQKFRRNGMFIETIYPHGREFRRNGMFIETIYLYDQELLRSGM
jgi:hypothetical protein